MNETCVEIVEKLQKLGADNAIATSSTSSRRQVKFANNKICRTSIEQAENIHVFLSIGKKTAETFLNSKEKDMDKKLGEAAALCKKLPDNKEFQGIASGEYSYAEVGSFDKRIASAEEECVEIVESALDSCADEVRAGGIFETNQVETHLYSSAGPKASSKTTGVYSSIRCLAEQNASGHRVAADTHLGNVDFAEQASQAKQLALQARNPVQGQEGTYNVVFDAFPFACLLDPFVHSTSVFSVESGLSALGGKIGKKVASNALTLCDDPVARSAFHATPFDAEGFPTRKTTLVEKGTLKTYLHNSSTAAKYKTASTGHAGITAPRPWNPSVKKGKASIDELISEAKNGLYITNTWYTRFQNYSTSDFSTIPRDAIMLVKEGELSTPVRGIRISDNLLNLLSNVALLSGNERQIYGWEVDTPIFSCDALVKNVKITTPTGGFNG